MSKLLIDESPLTVLPSLVKIVGLERAIILQQIHYVSKQPKSGKVLDDGFKYVWNTYDQWKEECFTFWKAETIRKHFNKLESEGLLISQQPNVKDWDRTKYYRIDYDELNDRIEATASNRIEPEDSTASKRPHPTASLKEHKTSSKTSTEEGDSPPERVEATEEKTESDNQTDEPPYPLPENPRTSSFASRSDGDLLRRTENAVGFALPIQIIERLEGNIPEKLLDKWIDFVKDRMCSLIGAHENFIKTKFGYWFTDFKRQYKFELEEAKPSKWMHDFSTTEKPKKWMH